MVHFLYKTNIGFLVQYFVLCFHVVFRELSQLHNPGIEHYMRIHQDFVDIQNPILPCVLMKLFEIIR